jgi:hypothetical protein
MMAVLGYGLQDHDTQCQGQMWVTGRKWVDLLFYNPDLPPVVLRIERDEAYIADLARCMDEFLQKLADAEVQFRVLTAPPGAPVLVVDRAEPMGPFVLDGKVEFFPDPPVYIPVGTEHQTVGEVYIPSPTVTVDAKSMAKAEFFAIGEATGRPVNGGKGRRASLAWCAAIWDWGKLPGKMPRILSDFSLDNWTELRDAAVRYWNTRSPAEVPIGSTRDGMDAAASAADQR